MRWRLRAANDPIADARLPAQRLAMKREFAGIAVATACFAAGWFAHGQASERSCHYTAVGYAPLRADLRALPKLPWDRVGDDVLRQIQRCWAAHPYEGPQYSLQFVEARGAPDGGYFVASYPFGITDIQLVFHVDTQRRVTNAYVASTQ